MEVMLALELECTRECDTAHVQEARMLCHKTVDLFMLLSHMQETGERQTSKRQTGKRQTGERQIGMTQELLTLVTGLAHHLKILIHTWKEK